MLSFLARVQDGDAALKEFIKRAETPGLPIRVILQVWTLLFWVWQLILNNKLNATVLGSQHIFFSKALLAFRSSYGRCKHMTLFLPFWAAAQDGSDMKCMLVLDLNTRSLIIRSGVSVA